MVRQVPSAMSQANRRTAASARTAGPGPAGPMTKVVFLLSPAKHRLVVIARVAAMAIQLFAQFALFLFALLFFVLTLRPAESGGAAFALRPAARRFWMLCIASALALAALAG
jgi:hypothetical protein